MFSVLLTSAENISITCNVYFRNQYEDGMTGMHLSIPSPSNPPCFTLINPQCFHDGSQTRQQCDYINIINTRPAPQSLGQTL